MKNKYLKTFITNPVAHLSGAVEHGDLGGEVGHAGGGLVLGVGGDVDALNPTLSPGTAWERDSWSISTDFTSMENWTGAKLKSIPGLMTPVFTRPTGRVSPEALPSFPSTAQPWGRGLDQDREGT